MCFPITAIEGINKKFLSDETRKTIKRLEPFFHHSYFSLRVRPFPWARLALNSHLMMIISVRLSSSQLSMKGLLFKIKN